MTAIEIQQLVAKGESECLELKASVPPADIIARHIASFANTQGGVLLFGIREPQQIVGVDETRLRRAIDETKRLLSGTVDMSLEVVSVDGRSVGALLVRQASGIVGACGGYYRRVGDSTRPLTAGEIRSHLSTARSSDTALSELSQAVARQTQLIEQLRDAFHRANSPWKKVGIGIGGAIIGALLKVLLEHLWK